MVAIIAMISLLVIALMPCPIIIGPIAALWIFWGGIKASDDDVY